MDSSIRDFLIGSNFDISAAGSVILAIIAIWSLAWKGVALWHSAQNREKYWFVAILVLNAAGIVEIAYLFYFSKKRLQLTEVLSGLKSLNPSRPGRK